MKSIELKTSLHRRWNITHYKGGSNNNYNTWTFTSQYACTMYVKFCIHGNLQNLPSCSKFLSSNPWIDPTEIEKHLLQFPINTNNLYKKLKRDGKPFAICRNTVLTSCTFSIIIHTSIKAKFCSKLICAAMTGLPGAVFNFASCILALKNSIIKF